jgi:hypothetical protein
MSRGVTARRRDVTPPDSSVTVTPFRPGRASSRVGTTGCSLSIHAAIVRSFQPARIELLVPADQLPTLQPIG